MTSDLKDKAIKIQGKDYVLVADRILFFNENFPNGSIKTELISELTSEQIIIKATVTPDTDKPARIFTGYSQAVVGQGYINKTSALENAETSAVGRALAMLGIGVIESVASADEIHKATGSQTYPSTSPVTPSNPVIPSKYQKKVAGETCPDCGGKYVLSPKTGAVFCENKCWLNPKPTAEPTEDTLIEPPF